MYIKIFYNILTSRFHHHHLKSVAKSCHPWYFPRSYLPSSLLTSQVMASCLDSLMDFSGLSWEPHFLEPVSRCCTHLAQFCLHIYADVLLLQWMCKSLNLVFKTLYLLVKNKSSNKTMFKEACGFAPEFPIWSAWATISVFHCSSLHLFDLSMLICQYPFQASNYSSWTLPHIFYSVFHDYEQVCFDSWFHACQSMIHWPAAFGSMGGEAIHCGRSTQ